MYVTAPTIVFRMDRLYAGFTTRVEKKPVSIISGESIMKQLGKYLSALFLAFTLVSFMG